MSAPSQFDLDGDAPALGDGFGPCDPPLGLEAPGLPLGPLGQAHLSVRFLTSGTNPLGASAPSQLLHEQGEGWGEGEGAGELTDVGTAFADWVDGLTHAYVIGVSVRLSGWNPAEGSAPSQLDDGFGLFSDVGMAFADEVTGGAGHAHVLLFTGAEGEGEGEDGLGEGAGELGDGEGAWSEHEVLWLPPPELILVGTALADDVDGLGGDGTALGEDGFGAEGDGAGDTTDGAGGEDAGGCVAHLVVLVVVFHTVTVLEGNWVGTALADEVWYVSE